MDKIYADFTAITLLIGSENAKKLSGYYGGHTVYIPLNKNANRNTAIRRARHGRKLSIKKLATLHNVSERTIFRVLKGANQ